MNAPPIDLGPAGKLAQVFLRSKLTPLLIIASLGLGVFSLVHLPREEEPQINVPMFDILVPFPGASAKEVEKRILNVGERKLWEIPGVEYIYSTAQTGHALFIVRFKVGTTPEEAMTRLYTKTSANLDQLAPGALGPLIKPRLIDDVPILALTLASATRSPLEIRAWAARLQQDLSAVTNVSETTLTGGHRRTFLTHFNPAQLKRFRITPLDVARAIQSSNVRMESGYVKKEGQRYTLQSNALITSAKDLEELIVGISDGRAVQIKDIAQVKDGPDDVEQEVLYGIDPAVTLAVSKRRGANATRVVNDIRQRLQWYRASGWPNDIEIHETRNDGHTAQEKSNELLFHMLLATISVTLLIAFTLGWREACVVAIAIPVTLALTLLTYDLFGYTLNRITLFALIFSIGILVDDAIVVVENIHRHFQMHDGRDLWEISVHAVAEVGNPTILATATVIAAILPMAFVGGLMGPYMRPIPVGASAAMIFSLMIAFVISPWAFSHLLKKWPLQTNTHTTSESRLDHLYRKGMRILLENTRVRHYYFIGIFVLLLASLSLLTLKAVTVKMLPFDNKSEMQIILNMPEGALMDRTQTAVTQIKEALKKIPEIQSVTSYVGSAAPHNFNGLVRHYFFRQASDQADLWIQLVPRHERKRQSHPIAQEIRNAIDPIRKQWNARIQVAEVPPGPPVLSTLVFEIYGPDEIKRIAFARRLTEWLKTIDGVVDVDRYLPDPQPETQLFVSKMKSTLNGIAPSEIVQTIQLAIEGQAVGIFRSGEDPEPVEIRLRLPPEQRKTIDTLKTIGLISRNGSLLSIGHLTDTQNGQRDIPIHHKNLRPVTYVIADLAGRQESPIYAILKLKKGIDQIALEEGISLKQIFSGEPESNNAYVLKWDGEWQITYDVFRDLGFAFGIVLILIYILVVAWFRSFITPLVIMAPIPLTLVGILPGHWLMGAFFTATSMIGFIAGAGIVVRNSIILVDFIQQRQKEGSGLEEAVIDAGAIRFRPMLLTAAAVVVGAGVILFDPIFQGLAISLIAGEVASTLLSRTAVPVLYFLVAHRMKSNEQIS